ncbi:tRNA delta(2)-isopentenylpyrophosphate transferase [Haemophilus haemolyticus]|uniref:tRNA delta(2)-isopentenylpyrophosphate transferase n=1 Tax=Haemophilus haemolyticus TaxID=726 RepID=UPI000E58D388|nr:tRNA delta(2)-isopentenylpyrophosphate transferase [Haemophilus haemolyticus]
MNSTKNSTLKAQFKQWLEEEQKTDDMIILVGISDILKRFDRRLAIIKGNRLEKRYLSEWRKLFRIDQEIARGEN